MNRKRLTPEIVKAKQDGATYAEIGKMIGGISRQRVEQLFSPTLAAMRLVSDRARALCEECGQFDQFGHFHHVKYVIDLLDSPDNIVYLCSSCHMKHHVIRGDARYCLNCGKVIKTQAYKFCSQDCQKAYHSVVHECSNCHRTFLMDSHQKIRIQRSQTGLIFCTKRCQGIYFGNHHNRRYHPRQDKKVSKYQSIIPTIVMRLRGEESLNHILVSYDVPQGSWDFLKKRVQEYSPTLVF